LSSFQYIHWYILLHHHHQLLRTFFVPGLGL
jgi:hypothetical protein